MVQDGKDLTTGIAMGWKAEGDGNLAMAQIPIGVCKQTCSVGLKRWKHGLQCVGVNLTTDAATRTEMGKDRGNE